MKIKWYIDENDGITGAYLHDGNLLGVFSENDRVILYIRNSLGQRVQIQALNARDCSVKDMLLGNIILDVCVYDISPKNHERLRMLLLSFYRNQSTVDEKWRIICRRYSNKKLLHLQPSYGAEIIIICEQIEVTEDVSQLCEANRPDEESS